MFFIKRFFPFIQFFLSCLVAVLSGCDVKAAADASANTGAKKQKTNFVRILNRLPDFNLTNQRQEGVGLSDLYGKVWIANFIFTRCHDVCPVQTQKMDQLQSTFKKYGEAWKDIGLVSFSVDPDYDTPEVLSSYIHDRTLETSQWHFLTGGKDVLWKLIKNGFHLPVANDAKNKKMPILHSSQFVLIDWEGRIRGYYDSLDAESINKLKHDTGTVFRERALQPADVASPGWVESRMNAQINDAKKGRVFTDFSFVDKLDETGITFHHKVLDDVTSQYKAVHYDHGNAIAIADVDSDGLYDIYFTTMIGTNELWRNLGNGKFEDITKKSGLFLDDRVGVGASFADIDNDGDQDLYITNVRLGNVLFENDGKGNFKDITKTSGVGVKAHSSGSVFFDFNRDGLLDLFVTNVGVYTSDEITTATVYGERGQHSTNYEYYIGFKDAFAGHLKPERTESSVLFLNKGNNKFEDVSKKTGLVDIGWSGEAVVFDGNQDGWPDLYVMNMQGHDEYYENDHGEKFLRKRQHVFPKTPWGAMGGVSLDFDNDGDLDLFVTDMHSDMSNRVLGAKEKSKSNVTYPESFLKSDGKSIYGNAFFKNEGSGSYIEVSDQVNVENYWPWGPSAGDLNADGFEDVFIAASMNYPFRYSVNSVLLNDNGKTFVDSEYVLGVEPRSGGRTAAPWFELDCSGKDTGHKMCAGNTKDRKIVWGSLGTRSSAIFDFDQDGDQDIVTLEFNQPPMLLVNNLAQKKKVNFIKIKLNGHKSNKNGIGALVKVYARNDVYTKANNGKSGYLSQSVYPLYFGLGGNKKIDKLEVIWPSGEKQTLSNVKSLNKLLVITES